MLYSSCCSLQLLLLLVASPLSFSCSESDQKSLYLFQQEISASPSLNWSLSDCCNWEGINCDLSGSVTTLQLPNRNLVGPISPFITNITTLVHINISCNGFSGNLSSGFFSSLYRLQVLDLSSNRMGGELDPNDHLPPSIHFLNLSNNFFSGTTPSSLFQYAKNLQVLDVDGNKFSGTIPSDICTFSPSLHFLDFSSNGFSGSVPDSLGGCTNLQTLRAGFCSLSGVIPSSIYSLSALQELNLAGNNLSGSIDSKIVNCTNLRILALYGNHFTGVIPRDIGKLIMLEQLLLHINWIEGTIPASLTNCTNLNTLILRVNLLKGELAAFDFSKFVNLQVIDLGDNHFNGSLPKSLFSCRKLTAIRLATNKFTGEIPPQVGSLQNLSFLSLSNNSLSNIGSAFRILRQCKNLRTLILSKNFFGEELPGDENLLDPDMLQNIQILAFGGCQLTGRIPNWMSKLINLEVVDISVNNLTGTVPGWFGDFVNLFYLDLSRNHFIGYFPMQLLGLRRLAFSQTSINADSNSLQLPVFIKPNNVSKLQYNQLSSLPPTIYINYNRFNGSIPWEIGLLKFIMVLDLGNNNFSGTIPDSVSNLTNLVTLDLSVNDLTGEIPVSIRSLHFLSSFNVACNNLQGPIPTGGQFDTFPISSFLGNPLLCGSVLYKPCGAYDSSPPSSSAPVASNDRKIIAVTLGVCSTIFVMVLALYLIFSRRRFFPTAHVREEEMDVSPEQAKDMSLVMVFPNNENKVETLSIADILKATDNFNQSNIIGCGGYGLVYRATLEDGTDLAIKKLSGEIGLMEREFRAEVEALSTAQHKNLVTLRGYCVHNGSRLLIYSYMEKGSLDYWLHEKPDGAAQLTWPIRLKIALGASRGIAYMHNECQPHIVHRDIKSSNILLNHDFEPQVADFGLARLILPYKTHVTTELVGTPGYIPPEYSQSWMATFRGDVYSFGVVLLELLSGKRPMEIFGSKMPGGLVAMVRQLRSQQKEEEIFDPLLRGKEYKEEMLKVVDMAAKCVEENPLKRPAIKAVVEMLEDVGSNQHNP